MSVILLIVGLLPACRAKNALMNLLGPGWSIARSARVGPNLFWRVGRMGLAERTYIGPFNAFRHVGGIEMDEGSEIGQFNWVTAAGRFVAPPDEPRRGVLALGAESHITSRHYVDCSGGVEIGPRSALGGVRCTVVSHAMNPWTYQQGAAPVVVGSACVIFTNVVVTAGVTIADRCVVAAGAVVSKDLTESEKLYGGVPAKVIADMTDATGFDRTRNRYISRESIGERLRTDWRAARQGAGNGSPV